MFDVATKCDECDPLPESESLLKSLFTNWDIFGKRVKRSSGFKIIKCRSCKGTGEYKQKRGKIVNCFTCYGSGVWRRVKCPKCHGLGVVYEKKLIDCWKCEGLGKIKIDPFNPVIRKGAILSIFI